MHCATTAQTPLETNVARATANAKENQFNLIT
jgi:hypothetical protein